jgi:hypothetical protein
VEAEFGRPAAALVAAVTEDRRRPWPQRKQEVYEVAARCGQPVGLILLQANLSGITTSGLDHRLAQFLPARSAMHGHQAR